MRPPSDDQSPAVTVVGIELSASFQTDASGVFRGTGSLSATNVVPLNGAGSGHETHASFRSTKFRRPRPPQALGGRGSALEQQNLYERATFADEGLGSQQDCVLCGSRMCRPRDLVAGGRLVDATR